MAQIYDPFEFIEKIGLFTIAIVGSFITMKLFNALYDNLYEPAMEVALKTEKTDKYYIKIGKYYIHIGTICKEFIKWLVLVVFLMICYNIIVKSAGRSSIKN